MKVEVIKNEDKEITYPCLMECKGYDLVVMFTDWKKGVVLGSRINWKVGDYSDDWDMTRFIPFKDKLVLSNE